MRDIAGCDIGDMRDRGDIVLTSAVILGLDPRIRGGVGLCCRDGPETAPLRSATEHRTVRPSGQARG